jgi:N-acetylglucosaminyl-diphospho-decaprenol L-rhamnosyltransferase
MTTHVAITIVGYKNVHDIVRCVSALANSTYADFEIVICENGGSVAFEALRAKLAPVLPGGQPIMLIEAATNGGYASGINICIAASPAADAWWLLNPDTEAAPGTLAALVARLEQGYDAVGGTLYFETRRVQSCGGLWLGWLARAVSIGNGSSLESIPNSVDVERRQNYLSGASMLVGRTFYEKTGPMAEDYFLYCEEVDWCLRAAAQRLKLGYASDARVLHHQGTTTGSSTSLKARSWISVYLDERNKMLLTRRHFPVRLPVAAIAALFLIALRYLRKGAFRQFGYGVSGWFAGLLGKSGTPQLP